MLILPPGGAQIALVNSIKRPEQMELTIIFSVVLGFFLGYSFCAFLVFLKGGLPSRETRILGKSPDRHPGLKRALARACFEEREYESRKSA
jgi:hypothetical protein